MYVHIIWVLGYGLESSALALFRHVSYFLILIIDGHFVKKEQFYYIIKNFLYIYKKKLLKSKINVMVIFLAIQ